MQRISRENIWKLQHITFMPAHGKQIFVCAFRCISYTQAWPSVESVRIMWPTRAFKLTSPDLKYDWHVCFFYLTALSLTLTTRRRLVGLE